MTTGPDNTNNVNPFIMSNMSIEEAQRILQEAGWQTIPPKPTGVVTEPNEEDVYWFCYQGVVNLEGYSPNSRTDRTMFRHRRIFHDEASAQKRLEDDEHYIEVDRRELEDVRLSVLNALSEYSIPSGSFWVEKILLQLNKLERILTSPLPQAEGPK